jgi:hypothetical protein
MKLFSKKQNTEKLEMPVGKKGFRFYCAIIAVPHLVMSMSDRFCCGGDPIHGLNNLSDHFRTHPTIGLILLARYRTGRSFFSATTRSESQRLSDPRGGVIITLQGNPDPYHGLK